MTKETIVILLSVLSAPFLGALISSYFGRRKTSAETHNLNVTGEISLGDSWQKYAIQQQKDKEELRKEFTDRINELKQDHNDEIAKLKAEFTKITDAKDAKIQILEDRIQELEDEVSRTKSFKETIIVAKDTIHTAVDVAADQIINDSK